MTKKDEGPPKAAFETLCSGSLPERMEHELQKIYENIADQNTEPTAKRKLVVEFTFSPNRERDASQSSVVFKNKLAPMVAAEGRVFHRLAMGKQVALVDNPPEQGELTFERPALKPVKDGTNG